MVIVTVIQASIPATVTAGVPISYQRTRSTLAYIARTMKSAASTTARARPSQRRGRRFRRLFMPPG